MILKSVFLCFFSFSAWISFLKMGGDSPLRTLLWEDFFNLRGGGGHFLDIFQKYKFISPKCFIIQCIFVITIVQLLQKSLHAAQAWFHRSPLLIHLVYHKQHLSILLISNPNIVTENVFSLWIFLFYSNTIFIDVFKYNKYKKHIIQCFLLLHLGYF